MRQRKQVKLDEFIREDKFELDSYVSHLFKQHSNDAPTRSRNEDLITQ
ncbi:hypothetical protein [Sediminibacillus massiliensis]|nr:hypothetical protein [Sediminibacillus massiliensis]